ncbi:hypothetical protein [Agrobacterium sp. NPDC090283]|uniref:hypothetical protein n=1 Tax=Agrobacterium sp. NPDC090283 TaxID=3363920 RepID=UPI00383B1D8E
MPAGDDDTKGFQQMVSTKILVACGIYNYEYYSTLSQCPVSKFRKVTRMLRRLHPMLIAPTGTLLVLSLMSVYGLRPAMAGDCPIVLDLNRDGRISTVTQTSSKEKMYSLRELLDFVLFDIDGDGIKDRIEWIDGTGDGFLVDATKIPASLQIDARALFGNMGFGDGFDSMASKDTDANGVLEGKELEGLKLWQDDGDAVLQADELKDLASFQITTIPVVGDTVEAKDGSFHMVANAETAAGQPMLVEDVWFLNVENLSSFEQSFESLVLKLI